MDGLIRAIMGKLESLKGKKVVLLLDGAPEHGKETELKNNLTNCPSFQVFADALKTVNADLFIKKNAANSPQLSMCEYYNRKLRTDANVMRNEQSIDALYDQEIPHGQKMMHRLNVLGRIIERCLEKLRGARPFATCYGKLLFFLDAVIKKQGHLDFTEPM